MANPIESTDPITEVIEDSLNDAMNPEVAEVDTADATTVSIEDAATEIVAETTSEDATTQVQSPAAKTPEQTKVEDEFAKKHGLQPNGVAGRENRIPYSRVKKIVEKNERDAVARVTKELESKFTPQVTELSTKVTDYEGRLEKVAQFEQILQNDPKTFLGMLSQVPAYKEFFDYIDRAAAALDGTVTPPKAVDPFGDMPQPDQPLPDGSKVYSEQGLKALLTWQDQQTQKRTIEQVEKRYAPIEQAWQAQEQLAKMAPIVERQIADARTWDKFNELEPKILEILKADKQISLEKAYVKAYQEAVTVERAKFTADRNAIRTEVLAEIKKKPMSSAAVAAAVKPGPQRESTGPVDTEEVIRRSLEEAGLLGQ